MKAIQQKYPDSYENQEGPLNFSLPGSLSWEKNLYSNWKVFKKGKVQKRPLIYISGPFTTLPFGIGKPMYFCLTLRYLYTFTCEHSTISTIRKMYPPTNDSQHLKGSSRRDLGQWSHPLQILGSMPCSPKNNVYFWNVASKRHGYFSYYMYIYFFYYMYIYTYIYIYIHSTFCQAQPLVLVTFLKIIFLSSISGSHEIIIKISSSWGITRSGSTHHLLFWSSRIGGPKWATKTTLITYYFPWNPGWLIGIPIMVYYNPYIIG